MKIVLWLSILFFSPDLKIGIIFDIFSLSRNTPSRNDLMMMMETGCSIMWAIDFRTLTGSLEQ